MIRAVIVATGLICAACGQDDEDPSPRVYSCTRDLVCPGATSTIPNIEVCASDAAAAAAVDEARCTGACMCSTTCSATSRGC